MSENHKDFKVTKCGGFIDQTLPWLHADFLCTCSCCGDGCGEVKCPYSVQNWDFESYLLKKSSCLEKVDGIFKLKRNHDYFYQVQRNFPLLDQNTVILLCMLLTTINQSFSWKESYLTPITGRLLSLS